MEIPMPAATTGPDTALDTGATSSVISGGRPATRATGGRAQRQALPRMAAFWLEAVVLGFVLLTSAAASPLYAVYQDQWKFSAATLTAVFAIYAIFLLFTLLLFGSVADYLGRRPVIA